MQVVVDEQVINYEKTGSGRTVVLVHGWGDSLSTFYDLEGSLAKQFTVVALDLPGFGQSSAIKKPWDLADYADCLNQFVKKLKLDVYAYVGHSNGCAILIYGLANKKISAKKLVLLSSAGIRTKNNAKKQLLKGAAKSGKAITAVLPKGVRTSLRGRFYKSIGSEMLLLPEMESTFKIIVAHDVTDDASKLTIPTLLVYGQEDKATPPEDGGTYSKLIKDSSLKIIDQAGHFVHRDQPLQVEGLIKEFL